MAPSSLTWLDQTDGERKRMLEIIEGFRERTTVDELGLGTIRDALAEHFFPGTSTIQTRARYLFFVPWIYAHIGEERVADVARSARVYQGRLAAALMAGGERDGVFGIERGEKIQRLPSDIYWPAIRKLGLTNIEGSLERLHAQIKQLGGRKTPSSEREGDVEPPSTIWPEDLPPAPSDLLDNATFSLTHSEAHYLRDRFLLRRHSAFLTFCLDSSRAIAEVNAPWDHPDVAELRRRDAAVSGDLEHARLFSLVMHGASLLYNLMLAELARTRGLPSGDNLSRYSELFGDWKSQIAMDERAISVWDFGAFQRRTFEIGGRVAVPTWRFTTSWLNTVRSRMDALPGDSVARTLIRSRERVLKGSLSRLENERALELWGGASGAARLVYRWPNARRIIQDVQRGLDRGRRG